MSNQPLSKFDDAVADFIGFVEQIQGLPEGFVLSGDGFLCDSADGTKLSGPFTGQNALKQAQEWLTRALQGAKTRGLDIQTAKQAMAFVHQKP